MRDMRVEVVRGGLAAQQMLGLEISKISIRA